jgi:hypothetical protein
VRYDRGKLIDVYLAVQAGDGARFGYQIECDEYNDALREYYRGLLTALERLFAVEFDRRRAESFNAKVFLMPFHGTVNSLLAARTPWSGFIEGGLIIKRLEESGAPGARFLATSDRIERLHTESRAAHLEALDAIVEILLGDRADSVFESADVLAAGFDDSARPDAADFPDPWD